jgi:hypothetical protein
METNEEPGMSRKSMTPTTARSLGDYLTEHPLVWICGLPGGAFAAAVSRIDGDLVEVTALAGGRKRHLLMPAGWNSDRKKAPVRTRAIRNTFQFHEAGFRVSCTLRRNPLDVLQLHVRYIDERSPVR